MAPEFKQSVNFLESKILRIPNVLNGITVAADNAAAVRIKCLREFIIVFLST